MKKSKMKQKGFILISMLFMMVLLAVTAITLNRRSALQSRMAANQIASIQRSLGQTAAVEHAIWKLTKDPFWRTASGGESYAYAGTTYNRKVLSSSVAGYTDAVVATVTAPGASRGFSTGFRYYLDDMFYVSSPTQIFIDTWDNVYIADPNNHSVFKMDLLTSEVTRVAGNGTSGFSGDGGPATSAQLWEPRGVWLDNSGVMYIADEDNHRIRKVDLAGNISTYAGDGTGDWGGDGGTSTSAQLKFPGGVFGDNGGNLYIADRGNHVIRKVDGSGDIFTVAGTGETSGDSGDGDAATSAKLNSPSGLFIASTGDIFVADRFNHKIRKFTDGGNIDTVVGTGSPGSTDGNIAVATLNSPIGVYVDETPDPDIIYIADTTNHKIRVAAEGVSVATFAGTGVAGYSGDGSSATLAQLDNPADVYKKSTGETVIADSVNSCLREVGLNPTYVIETITSAGDPGFNSPAHIAMDSSGNVFIADKSNNRIRKLDTNGIVTTVAGTGVAGSSGDGGLATNARLDHPQGVSVDSAGNIYVADTQNCNIRKFTEGGNIYTAAGKGVCGFDAEPKPATSAKLNYPEGVFIDDSGDFYIADTNNHTVRWVNGSTQTIDLFAGTEEIWGYSGDGGAATSAKLKQPQGVWRDSSGNTYIADTGNHCIRKVSSGNISTVAGIGTQGGYSGDGGAATSAKLNDPKAVFVDSAGNLFIADQGNHVIRVVSVHDSKIYTLAGTGSGGYNGGDQPAVEAQLNAPSGLTMASTRGGMKIYLSDRQNNRIRTLGFRIAKKLY